MGSIKLIEWLMLIATAAGPLVGVWVTRWVDKLNDKDRRREAVFEALVRTRGLELGQEHVSNLNMVPLLFKEPAVVTQYQRMMAALNNPAFASPDEHTATGAVQAANAARRDLIREIGKAVGTPLPEGENERHGYAPILWEREQRDIIQLRTGLIEMIEGRKPLQAVAAVFEIDPNQAPAGAQKKAGRTPDTEDLTVPDAIDRGPGNA